MSESKTLLQLEMGRMECEAWDDVMADKAPVLMLYLYDQLIAANKQIAAAEKLLQVHFEFNSSLINGSWPDDEGLRLYYGKCVAYRKEFPIGGGVN